MKPINLSAISGHATVHVGHIKCNAYCGYSSHDVQLVVSGKGQYYLIKLTDALDGRVPKQFCRTIRTTDVHAVLTSMGDGFEFSPCLYTSDDGDFEEVLIERDEVIFDSEFMASLDWLSSTGF